MVQKIQKYSGDNAPVSLIITFSFLIQVINVFDTIFQFIIETL